MSTQAATVALSGRIQGRLNADWMNENLTTLHFYFIEVTAPTTITMNWCVTNGPGGNFGSGIDLHVFPYTDPFQDMQQIWGLSGGAFCTSDSRLFTASGSYLLSVSP